MTTFLFQVVRPVPWLSAFRHSTGSWCVLSFASIACFLPQWSGVAAWFRSLLSPVTRIVGPTLLASALLSLSLFENLSFPFAANPRKNQLSFSIQICSILRSFKIHRCFKKHS